MKEQKETPFTKFPNYLFEPLYQSGLSTIEFQVVIFIASKTVRYNKNYEYISISKIAENVIASERQVARALKDLERRKIIIINKSKYMNSYKFNFKFSEWITPNKAKKGNQEEHFIPDQEPKTPLELKRHILEFAPGRMIYFKYDDYIIDGIRKDNNTVELLNKSNEMTLYSIDHIKLSDLQK